MIWFNDSQFSFPCCVLQMFGHTVTCLTKFDKNISFHDQKERESLSNDEMGQAGTRALPSSGGKDQAGRSPNPPPPSRSRNRYEQPWSIRLLQEGFLILEMRWHRTLLSDLVLLQKSQRLLSNHDFECSDRWQYLINSGNICQRDKILHNVHIKLMQSQSEAVDFL